MMVKPENTDANFAAILPYKGGVEPYREFCERHGLPVAASLSVALTVRAHFALRQRWDAQLRLPWAKVAALVQCRTPLNEYQASLAVRWSREHGFPLDTIYCMLQQGKAPMFNPLSVGWRQMAQTDPRILKGAGTKSVEQTPKGVLVVYEVQFWNGEVYEGTALCDADDRQVKERGTSVMAAIAETRAANRAYRVALRPLFSDLEEE